MKTVQNTFATFLMLTILAPSFYFGIAPPKEVEAQSMGDIVSDLVGGVAGATACATGSLFSDLVDWAVDKIKDFITNIIGDILGGIADWLGLGDIFGDDGISMEETVPVTVAKLKGKAEKAADAEVTLEFKECVLDSIIWTAKHILIDTITASIFEWINSGFYGSPVFVRDPGEWAKALALSQLDQFLTESGVDEFLCEPFGERMIHSVSWMSTQPSYGGAGNASCNLGIVGGVDGYTAMVEDGVLGDGGIMTAMGLAEEGNNTYSSLFNLQSEASARVAQHVSSEMKLLDYGDGYHSMRCGEGDDFGVCTPGQFISKQIDDWAGGSLGQLEVADEVSEIVQELFAHMVESVFYDNENGLLRDVPEING